MSLVTPPRRPASFLETQAPNAASPLAEAASWLAVVAEKARGLHFGTIQITVHDSRVVQIERVERTRFEVVRSA